MTERFDTTGSPWRQDEIQKLHLFAGKGTVLKRSPRRSRAAGRKTRPSPLEEG
jgi:hypothetical protein